MLEGVDISSRVTNADALAASAAFVYQKATDGVGSPSSVIVQNCNGLRIAGKGAMLGAYHFLRARHGRAQDADRQCKEFLEMRSTAGCPLISWLDIELGEDASVSYSNRHATRAEVRAAVVMFVETWSQETGDMLAWYSSPGEAQAMGLVDIPELRLLPLALADYEEAFHVPAPFSSPPAFWQYAGTSVFDGVSGGADRVRFFGTEAELIAL